MFTRQAPQVKKRIFLTTETKNSRLKLFLSTRFISFGDCITLRLLEVVPVIIIRRIQLGDIKLCEWQSFLKVKHAVICSNCYNRIEVFNKADLFPAGEIMPHGEDICAISARGGEGVERLLEMIDRKLDKGTRRVTLRLPYDKGGLLDMLYRETKVESVEYGETIDVIAVCGPRTLGQVRAYAEGLPPEEKEEW